MQSTPEKEVIFTWREVVSSLGVNLEAVPKDLGSLITRGVNSGIGKPISRQKTAYKKNDLEILSVATKWWLYLDRHSNLGWRDEITSKTIQDRLIKSLTTGNELVLFAIFCPSYKTGLGVHGYKREIGDHTKILIKDFCGLVSFSRDIGIKVQAVAYFSDLLLENLERLDEKDKNDLAANYESFCREFSSYGVFIETPLLSSNKRCRTEIKEEGISSDATIINKDLYSRILKRNTVFYESKLSWSPEKIKDRTDVIWGSYIKLAEIFNREYPEGIMFWTESLFERGLIYSQNKNNYVPIIYPLKHVVTG